MQVALKTRYSYQQPYNPREPYKLHREELEGVVGERDILGAQLIRRNEVAMNQGGLGFGLFCKLYLRGVLQGSIGVLTNYVLRYHDWT